MNKEETEEKINEIVGMFIYAEELKNDLPKEVQKEIETQVKDVKENVEKIDELVEMWLDAEEENRKHTVEGEAKCLELKNKVNVEASKLPKGVQKEIESQLYNLGG